MADDPQKNFPLPGSNNSTRKSAEHLPAFFRTETNSKFLTSTFDQLIQPGTVEKINAYFGRKQAKQFRPSDSYVGDVSRDRENYQFEPAAVIKDSFGNPEFYKDYNDYVNEIKNLGGNVDDHSILNSQEYYAWNPHIDWDKFVNYREYYWLPNGPQPVPVAGDQISQASTYSVTNVDNLDNFGFVLTPDGFTQNPELVLYRGVTYRFEIDSPGLPFSLRSNRTTAKQWAAGTFYQSGETVVYEGSIYVARTTHRAEAVFESENWDIDTRFNLTNEVNQQGIEIGVVEFTPNNETPDYVYYVSDADLNAGGLIRIYDIEEASFVDVEKDIIGKSAYTTGNGFDLSNGMKIYFQGTTLPELYQKGFYYVEGVGEAIELVPEETLTLSSAFLGSDVIEFDTEGFDTVPYSTAIGFPENKDYITIARTAKDGNLWSKYNRWFHREIIEQSANINGTELILDREQRAKRPVIEFEKGIKLYNFGTQEKEPVDLIDDFTRDVFSTVEGKSGYNVDGVDLTNGMRVLFTADTDARAKDKIYEVKFIDFKGKRQIALVETADSLPLENETVLIGQGNEYQGQIFFYDGNNWKLGQQKTDQNQEPLFDVFNCAEVSLGNKEEYPSSDFQGTPVFSYQKGHTVIDPELGFSLSYRNIENIGDILFDFNLLTDSASFCPDNETIQQEPFGLGYLRKYSNRNDYQAVNGWSKAASMSEQPVIRLYTGEPNTVEFPIDVYENSAQIDDISVKVYLNDSILREQVDYEVVNRNTNKSVVIYTAMNQNDVVKIKTVSSQPKNENGFYEIPINLERNPENSDIQEVTLGEINDHVSSIIENLAGFEGAFPGVSNLRDAGNVTPLGNKIVKHSVPINLPLYHILDRDANIVKSIQFAKNEYSKFKRQFLKLAYESSFSGAIKEHVDYLLTEIFKTKTTRDPFYFSDMVPRGASKKTEYPINSPQQRYFALSDNFTVDDVSDQAVLVYKNSVQLTVDKDYVFNSEGFVDLSAPIQIGDVITIYEYESTLGSFVPQTPTKLGLYPAYKPEKLNDDTYLESQTLIQGHDGSKILAFGDFRDDLLLELEKRIYNNIKVSYDPDIFDLYNFVPGDYRQTNLSKKQINNTLLPEFIDWLRLVDEDYTENATYDRQNPFTWNYSGATDWQGNTVSGFWRSVYINAYDTDSPHKTPWKMQGFGTKPDWWEKEYGPEPYTKGNLLLWEDIEQGIIRDPSVTFRTDKRFARPGLTSHLPVDDNGKLLSPLYSGFIDYFNADTIKSEFKFGDRAPVETAWRRSSEYPYALLNALVLNQPARVFAVAFDRIRQTRDLTGQIVYQSPNRQIQLKDVQFPNTAEDNERIYTSGLVNFVKDYISSSVTSIYESYKNNIISIENQIGFKLAGFTGKEKFNLILDSRTPSNNGNVFVPEENFQVFLNKSTPIQNIYYSGVIVEKTESGYLVRGYSDQKPYFEYLKPQNTGSDAVVNVGGVSENVIQWEPGKIIQQGEIVEYQKTFYRARTRFETGNVFETDNLVEIPEVPIIGGRSAIFRTRFEQDPARVSYGEKFQNIQDVVDFILGYGAYLEARGFVFDYFDSDSATVADWKNAAREFLFWTTQNWSEGSVIALSPAAFRLKFNTQFAAVDDIFDTFYGYSLRTVDGSKLSPENTSLIREDEDTFTIRTKNTEDGIFAIRISLIQKEHAVLLDNRTVFGDIIFDKAAGYRQERIRVLGYRTANWNGSLNIPGFIYDSAKIKPWEPWKDYAIGDLVSYKEFVYSADTAIQGTSEFNSQDWVQLREAPTPGLLPNWEYKTNQFADFYDLDTDSFDAEQQKFAQHLIGYQNRQYLSNIINDDVSQYKFYQGFIQEKGTSNSLRKLFDVLGSANKDSLEFYEEWAIRAGRYGATDGFEDIEFLLDEKQFRVNPQPISLESESLSTDLVYRIHVDEVYQKPDGYDHAPFPELSVTDTFTKDAGYIHPDDADFRLNSYQDILNIPFNRLLKGSTIWIGNYEKSWSVFTCVETDLEIESIEQDDPGYRIDLVTAEFDFKDREIIGIFNTAYQQQSIVLNTPVTLAKGTKITQPATGAEGFLKEDVTDSENLILVDVVDTFEDGSANPVEEDSGDSTPLDSDNDTVFPTSASPVKTETSDGLYEIDSVVNNSIYLKAEQPKSVTRNAISGRILRFKKTRFENFSDANSVVPEMDSGVDRIWVDKDSFGNWRAIEKTNTYATSQTLSENTIASHDYGMAFDTNRTNTTLAVGSPNENDGKVYVYTRGSASEEFSLSAEIEADRDIADANQQFGASVAVTDDGNYLIVGSPSASNVKTFYKGDYSQDEDYAVNSIVNFNGVLWQSTTNIEAADTNTTFESFQSVIDILLKQDFAGETDEPVYTLLSGNYPNGANTTADHFLVRPPVDMYVAAAVGDSIELDWNPVTYANQDRRIDFGREPFEGDSGLTSDLITDIFVIQEKIDSVLNIEEPANTPLEGDIVETSIASGIVSQVNSGVNEISLYIKDQSGSFGNEGTLVTSQGNVVGNYVTVAPQNVSSVNDEFAGFFKLSASYQVGNSLEDTGKNLVFADLIPQGGNSHGFYYNILDFQTDTSRSRDSVASEIIPLSYTGSPGPGGVTGDFLSELFVMRAPVNLTGAVDDTTTYNDQLSAGDTVDIFYNTVQSFDTGNFIDPAEIGLEVSDIYKTQTVQDIWDGYLNVELTRDYQDETLFPRVGLTIRDTVSDASAEIVFFQKFNTRDIRIFVKNVTGNWGLGSDFGQPTNVEFLADGTGDPIYDPRSGSRVFGNVESRSIGLKEAGIGKLLVFSAEEPIEVGISRSLEDSEYWFYQQNVVEGAPLEPSIPGANNNEWFRVYSIPAVSNGVPSSYLNEGLVSVYEKQAPSKWNKISSFVVPDTKDDLELGYQIRTGEIEGLVKVFVSSRGNKGKIYLIKNGSEAGYDYNWSLGQSKQYQGEFSSLSGYDKGDVVFKEGKLYKAATNITAGSFSSVEWENAPTVDYLGYIPNTSGLELDDINTLGVTDVEQFAEDFAVSDNSEVVAVTVVYGTESNKLAVYRNINNAYVLDQILDSSNSNLDNNIGSTVDISPDGEFVAVGSPLNDRQQTDEGTVFILHQTNGRFVDSQTLLPPEGGRALLFGSKVIFSESDLLVASENGSGILETVFDDDNTTFDKDLLDFRTVNYNSGLVYGYQKIDNNFLYGQTIDLDDFNVRYFGRNLHAQGNHLYVGLPNYPVDNSQGALVCYSNNGNIWKDVRKIKTTVDTNKIKKVFLYNTKDQVLLENLDYIDIRQGKIAGPAEQEIDYKTFFDPAIYTNGEFVETSEVSNWNKQQVGKVWWDLTNARFLNPYLENTVYSTNNWNTLYSEENSIDVYEWVESTDLPSEWDAISETDEGFQQNVTGTTKYGDSAYAEERIFDSATQSIQTRYYFWVKNRKTVPVDKNRKLSAYDIARLIENPQGQGYKFIAFISPTEFALYNCSSLIKDKDIALSIQYYTIEQQDSNIHNQYQIISEGLANSRPERDIEQKWFDSLIGFDLARRPVPALELTAKEKFGNLNQPRQSWFQNRTEALKQLIDRVNRILRKNLIVETRNISRLDNFEEPPSVLLGRYDESVESNIDLDLISTANFRKAQLSPVIENGKIISVNIQDSGFGYQTVPPVDIIGTGENAQVELYIDASGRVIEAQVVDSGENYTESTVLGVRSYSVLVENDSELDGSWAIYAIDSQGKWERAESQSFDVRKYWKYQDWYEDGYGVFTDINHVVDFSYELSFQDIAISETVKINNIGSGGWLLLEKVNDLSGVDYTINYKTIGRKDGTIQLLSNLYDTTESLTGFDTTLFDSVNYDSTPSTETRIILETIRDDIFVDDLAVEYNNLFFASLRYVFAEQINVDWAFKTSFVKAQHNVGDLDQKITFKNDNLESYEDYFQEVKPYKTTIREYVSDYETLDNTRSIVSDFDLPPRFNAQTNRIEPYSVKQNGTDIVAIDSDLEQPIESLWLNNAGYTVTEIEIGDPGFGYTAAPFITIEGGGGEGAEAQASIGRSGEITSVKVTNRGRGYVSAPSIRINGSQTDAGTPARLSAVIGDSPVRTLTTTIAFDRVSGAFGFEDLATTEEFVSAGSRNEYDLEWPMNLKPSKVKVFVDGIELLPGTYSYSNQKDVSKGYERYKGKIKFVQEPANNKNIRIEYEKSVDLLNAQDRINLLLENNRETNLAEYLKGIDYGGVEVNSVSWQIASGWDTAGWFDQPWDVFDDTFEDEIINLDGSTLTIELAKPLEVNETYNVYRIARDNNGEILSNVRLDDPNFGTQDQTNQDAVFQSLVGDGSTTEIELDSLGVETDIISPEAEVSIIIRKETSDGSMRPLDKFYDTNLTGGDLAYQTATGLSAEDIIVDGDGFVTPKTSEGPEESIPGQVMDTLDIQVYEKPASGSSQITSLNFIGDGITNTFDIPVLPVKQANVFVKIDNEIQNSADYVIDYTNKQIIFINSPSESQRINILILGYSADDIIAIESFTGDGEITDFLIDLRYNDEYEVFASVNGITRDAVLIRADDSFDRPDAIVVRFSEPPAANTNISVLISRASAELEKNYSEVSIDEFTADGSTTEFTLENNVFDQQPAYAYTLVTVNNKVLNAGYSKVFTVDSRLEYPLDDNQIPAASVDFYKVEAYLNGRRLEQPRDYRYVSSGAVTTATSAPGIQASTVVLKPGIAATGDELKLFVVQDSEYKFGFFDEENLEFIEERGEDSTYPVLHLNDAYSAGDVVRVYTFSNHNSQGIERYTLEIEKNQDFPTGTAEYYEYRKLTNGVIPLRKPAASAQWVWINLNGYLLDPSVDYWISNDRKYAVISQDLNEGDTVDIIHFAETPTADSFGWRQFKDMLNKTHFKKLGVEYRLKNDLNWYDTEIVLEDGSGLPTPEFNSREPGVVFINGERIEYFVKSRNVLKQIRRGTLGTGIKNTYHAGTAVQEQGRSKTIPYNDRIVTQTAKGTGDSNLVNLEFTATTKDELEIFVAGKRLSKDSKPVFDREIAQDSPEGDSVIDAEFTIDTATNSVIFRDVPAKNADIVIVKKQGSLWNEIGSRLADSDSDIANFIKS
jgi:hypothetical protein